MLSYKIINCRYLWMHCNVQYYFPFYIFSSFSPHNNSDRYSFIVLLKMSKSQLREVKVTFLRTHSSSRSQILKPGSLAPESTLLNYYTSVTSQQTWRQDCASQCESLKFKGLKELRAHLVQWLPNFFILDWTLFLLPAECHVREYNAVGTSVRKCVRLCERCRGQWRRCECLKSSFALHSGSKLSLQDPMASETECEDPTRLACPSVSQRVTWSPRAGNRVCSQILDPHFSVHPSALFPVCWSPCYQVTAQLMAKGLLLVNDKHTPLSLQASPWVAWMFECF